jgi:hypothetical protein
MRGGEDPCEVFAQPPPVLDPAEGLDMPGAGQQPELLGRTGGLEQGDPVVGWNHPVGLALDDQDRQRRELGDPRERPVAIIDGQAERSLQQPGRPEARELLPGERAIADERALDDQGADAGLGLAGQRRLDTRSRISRDARLEFARRVRTRGTTP